MLTDAIGQYVASPAVTKPYFVFVGDRQYSAAINQLSAMGFESVRMSSFCSSEDKVPDIDKLVNYLETADPDAKGKKFMVTGIGEFLALRGSEEAVSTLSRLKDQNVGAAKAVLLLRGLASLVAGMQTDPRFDNRRYTVVDEAECDLSFTVVPPSMGLSASSGFKTMLAELEGGRCGNVIVSTAINLDSAILAVHQISNAYEGVKYFARDFAVPYSCGSDDQWAKLLIELDQGPRLPDEVFKKHGLGNDLESSFYTRIAGNEYQNWLYFICLKSKADTVSNEYLRFVLDRTTRFEDFVGNVLNAIIEIPHTDERFRSLYQARKVLVEKFPESDIARFVINNRQVVSESIYRLTDETRVEREEIVAWLSNNGTVPQLEAIYPVLAAYLGKYVFKCTELADLLTEYFEAYKRQKLSNKLEPAFLGKVEELAVSRKYNQLPTREEILDSIDKNDTFLYWLDALGVEYLGLIEFLAQRRNLSVRIHIARAQLPTVTPVNRGFYDSWQGRKEKNDELDDTKHGDASGYSFVNNELPIHLAKELDIVTAVIDRAATEVAQGHCKRFLLVSDHGASRLAVLRRKEEKYDADTEGEHSGRCCKTFFPHDLPFAAEEHGYLVLADYGRFRGSRAANVEVHGGASLEEVVVPVIELSLRNGNVTVKLENETVSVDPHTGAEIGLFFNSPVRNVMVVLNGKRYRASQVDANRYAVRLPDMRRAGNYAADIYSGDDLVGRVMIKAKGKSGGINDDFDDLF